MKTRSRMGGGGRARYIERNAQNTDKVSERVKKIAPLTKNLFETTNVHKI